MNAKQRRAYWVKTERIRAQLERKYYKQIFDLFMKAGSSLTSTIDQVGYQQALNMLATETWSHDLLNVYASMVTESYTKAAKATYSTMIRVARVKKDVALGGMGRADQWQLYVQNWLRENGLQRVTTISGGTRDSLLRLANEAIQKGIDQGMGQREIAKLIKDSIGEKWEGYSAYRALRIARTETGAAANMGHMKGAESLPYFTNKVWISAKDKRTRRIPEDDWDHWALDGQTVDYEAPFTSISEHGVQVEVMQPGAPEQAEGEPTPAGFVINCRCRVAFIEKRDANGRLILKPKEPVRGAPTVPRPVVPMAPAPPELPPAPVPVKPTSVPTFVPGKNKEATKKALAAWVKQYGGFTVDKMAVSSKLTDADFNRRAETVANLFRDYKIDPVSAGQTNAVPMNFTSTASKYGYVQSWGGRSGGLVKVNFGHTTDLGGQRTWLAGSTTLRRKSAVDDANADIATTVHEFAHIMAVSSRAVAGTNAPSWVTDFFTELRDIGNEYVKEVRECVNVGFVDPKDTTGLTRLNEIHLGTYANTNLNEFMAEGWTEYKLKAKPSKYALKIGALIDKHFKR